mmetsp:Transcript_28514/g.78286  ORF Transcript_28514/g.78286 Transcript_28514/m.78286 type:complete len:279 (-) Transcript_28514:976-1812(-)
MLQRLLARLAPAQSLLPDLLNAHADNVLQEHSLDLALALFSAELQALRDHLHGLVRAPIVEVNVALEEQHVGLAVHVADGLEEPPRAPEALERVCEGSGTGLEVGEREHDGRFARLVLCLLAERQGLLGGLHGIPGALHLAVQLCEAQQLCQLLLSPARLLVDCTLLVFGRERAVVAAHLHLDVAREVPRVCHLLDVAHLLEQRPCLLHLRQRLLVALGRRRHLGHQLQGPGLHLLVPALPRHLHGFFGRLERLIVVAHATLQGAKRLVCGQLSPSIA